MVETHNNIHVLGFILSKLEKKKSILDKNCCVSFIGLDQHKWSVKCKCFLIHQFQYMGSGCSKEPSH